MSNRSNYTACVKVRLNRFKIVIITYSIDVQSWADLSMYEIWPISHFKGPTSDFRWGCYNYPQNVLSRFYQFLTWRKTAIYIGFPALYSCVYLYKIAVSLASQGIEHGRDFVYGCVYAMRVCICAWICGWMWNVVLIIILYDL